MTSCEKVSERMKVISGVDGDAGTVCGVLF